MNHETQDVPKKRNKNKESKEDEEEKGPSTHLDFSQIGTVMQ